MATSSITIRMDEDLKHQAEMLFEEMGIMYLGPVDGNNISAMRRIFEEAKRVDGPVLVHVLTQKGAGYGPARSIPFEIKVDPFYSRRNMERLEKAAQDMDERRHCAVHPLLDAEE